MAKDFDPIFDRVVIKRNQSSLEKKVSGAGLMLPDDIKDNYQASEGTLVKCGSDCHPDVVALLGKQVLFAKYSGDDLTLNGEKDYVLATDKDIFGGITND